MFSKDFSYKLECLMKGHQPKVEIKKPNKTCKQDCGCPEGQCKMKKVDLAPVFKGARSGTPGAGGVKHPAGSATTNGDIPFTHDGIKHHLENDRDGKYMIVANYSDGNRVVGAVHANGHINLSDSVAETGLDKTAKGVWLKAMGAAGNAVGQAPAFDPSKSHGVLASQIAKTYGGMKEPSSGTKTMPSAFVSVPKEGKKRLINDLKAQGWVKPSHVLPTANVYEKGGKSINVSSTSSVAIY